MDVKLSKLAIGSIVLAILGIVAPILSLPGLVFGLVSLHSIKHSNGLLKGRGIAISGIVLSVIILLLTIFTIFHYRQLYRMFKVPSVSMVPTIKQNESVVVYKKAYASKMPQRGDIIVFELEKNGKKTLQCKRIVGLSRESLEIKEGRIYINGILTQIPELPASVSYANTGYFGGQGKVVMIPDDSYYVLGDNPVKSQDSRCFGFVNKSVIYGKVIFTYTGFPPLNRIVQLLKSPVTK